MVGGLSLPNATKRDFQDTTELHCSERMRCKPSKITKIETKTCIFWWTKIQESPQLHSFRIISFCKGIWWIYKMNGPARKICEVFEHFGCVFCFDATGKHSAKCNARVLRKSQQYFIGICCCYTLLQLFGASMHNRDLAHHIIVMLLMILWHKNRHW